MAEISTHQYKLRSGKQDSVHLPVELQMPKDRTFLRGPLASQKPFISGQVSANDSSIHEYDCEVLIASLKDKQNL